MNEKVTFPKGTPIRCNRCDTKSFAPREFEANREASYVWRQSGMMLNPARSHPDGHWVFSADILKVSEVMQQALSLVSGTLAALTGVKEYDALQEIQADFVPFCAEHWNDFERWQEAWAVFAEHHDTWTPCEDDAS